jgi:uncharacterized protein (TIGR02246 family)
MIARSVLVPFLSVAVVAGEVHGQVSAVLRAKIQDVVGAYVEAHNRADAAAIADMYTREPGVTSVGDGEIIRGWDRIRERLDLLDELAAADAKLQLRVGSIDIVPLTPDLVLVLSSYTATVGFAGGEIRERGAMTLVLKSVGGEWKILHDHTSSKREEPAGAAPSAPAGAPEQPGLPVSIPISDGRAVEVPAQNSVRYSFTIPQGSCLVSGRIEGISGGNKDFEAFILDDDNLRNWTAGLTAQTHWNSGRTVVTNINVQLVGPGTYHLVLSNVFSIATPKTVQASAQAQCQ